MTIGAGGDTSVSPPAHWGCNVPDVVVSNEGEREASRLVLKAELVVPRVWHLRLFKNNYIPHKDTVLADLQQATFPGYVPLVMNPDDWSVAVTVGGAAVSYFGSTFTQFPCSFGTQDIYGYYITFNNGANLFLSQRFDVMQTVTATTPGLVWPELTDESKYAPDPPP